MPYVCQLCFNATRPEDPPATRKVFGIEMHVCPRCRDLVDSGGDVDAVMGEAVRSRSGVGALPEPPPTVKPGANRRVELRGTVVGAIVARAVLRELKVTYETTCDVCGHAVGPGEGFQTANTVLCDQHLPKV